MFNNWLLIRESEEQGFIQALNQNPKDYTSWGVYADWLEEQGHDIHELIRKLVIPGTKKTSKVVRSLESIWNSAPPQLQHLLAKASNIAMYATIWRIGLSEVAQVLRLIRSAKSRLQINDAMRAINSFIKGHGVETVQGNVRFDNYYGHTVAEYINKGDTYDLTVIYDIPRHKFYIMDLGTWVEKNQNRYGIA